MLEFFCPNDGQPLKQTAKPSLHACAQCQGEFLLDASLMQGISQRFHQVVAIRKVTCPGCKKDMTPFHFNQGSLELDLCIDCKAVWFDANEQAHFLRFMREWKKRVTASQKISRRRKKAARQTTEEQVLYTQYEAAHGQSGETQNHELLLQLLLGLPVERNIPPFKTPVVNLSLVFINIAILVLAFLSAGRWYFASGVFDAKDWGFFPMLFSIFSHGDLLHLLGNMWFLYLVGDNVEDLMGRWRYLLFYLFCGFAAAMAFALANPEGSALGASGAISGVMAAYLVFFPHARFALRFFLVYEVEVPCWALFLFYFAMDAILLGSNDGVGHSAHLGGFLSGLVVALFFKKAHLV